MQTTTVTLHNVLHVPDLLKKGNHVTRLMSQRAAHKTHNQYRPVFIDAADFSVIDVGHFYIPMDQHVQHNLLTLQGYESIRLKFVLMHQSGVIAVISC